jgi:catechol 2,3-dioxygenase-like lactoylglutathione lyase family enzyme
VANTFGTDILIQAEDPMKAADFYVKELGFEITDKNPKMIGLHGENINLFIEPGPALGPVFEVTVKNVNVKEAKARLQKKGCQVIKDEPNFKRLYGHIRFHVTSFDDGHAFARKLDWMIEATLHEAER